jgi:UTP-glucose-1-phosphate uridylyltransferase
MNTDTQEQERVMNIVVNGKEYKVGQQLSYEEAVRLHYLRREGFVEPSREYVLKARMPAWPVPTA